IAGAMRGLNSGQSSAFWELIRIMRDMEDRRPALVLLENVPGFLMSRNGKDLEAALLALNELGYLCDVFFVDASHFVPQSRTRLFVVGKRGYKGSFPFGLTRSPARSDALVDFIVGHPNIKWDIRGLPDFPKRGVVLDDVLEDLADDDPAWW